jgi:hypothetical protein
MPWIPHCDPPGETPAHYSWRELVLSDDTVLGLNIEYAKEQRKQIGQLREHIVSAQKQCGKERDIDGARSLSDIAADLMKQYRGWDGAINIIEGDNDFWHGHVAEPIAPYVDRAFAFIELYEPGVQE